MTFAPGALVRARGREWVVLPASRDDLIVARPLGGSDDEIAGIHTGLETVEPATFQPPDPKRLGDHRSCRLLRDAVRLGFRASAGPFRSFAQIAVEPRPYQLVPLLMALRMNPVRLLVADDVGIGKTVEAALIARELLDRGDAQRLAVLCPPHLAEQWQRELRTKFHIETELVLPGTAARLERNCAVGQSLFDVYPQVVVSMEFIKSDRHREEFLRTCPDLVIVDEAHTCAYDAIGRSARHQRHHIVSRLAANPDRHLILVTATPHSGNENAFRSLLAFLDPAFAEFPEDLTGKENEHHRRRLAQHFVQRRRGDIRQYLDAATLFPDRDDKEDSYKLSKAYRALFERVLSYARESVRDATGDRRRQRVRWWSALALLRSLASSPAAAASTLRARASNADSESADEADEVGRRIVLDQEDGDTAESIDVVPGGDATEGDDAGTGSRRRLLDMARAADALAEDGDEKLKKVANIVRDYVADGFSPIVFCRFIPTAEYVAAELRKKLGKDVEVAAVTSTLAPAEREERVLALAKSPKHVLVATDCLSEGINLQDHFDGVVHYDLSWNPTRHEQREGRVDRYGQPKALVRVLTYYGIDNQIDGIVLDVLLRKHRTIRNSLGISVPVPVNTNQVVEALFEGLLLRENAGGNTDGYLPGLDEYLKPQREDLHRKWDAAASREKRSRTLFAQETIKVDEVARELTASRAAVGSAADVASFIHDAVIASHGAVTGVSPTLVDLRETPRGLRDAMGAPQDAVKVRYEMPIREGEEYLPRTHPWVSGLAGYVLDSALDPLLAGAAARSGVIRTSRVATRTTLLLLRLRHHIHTRRGASEKTLLAEECVVLGFTGSPESAKWLSPSDAEALLDAEPQGNIGADQAAEFVAKVVEATDLLRPHFDAYAHERAAALLDAHRRVRVAAAVKGVSHQIEPVLPADIVGAYVYLPVPAGGPRT